MAQSTKERILLEALQLFAEQGYEGSNLRDLAARLDLSKSALYRHFTSKEDIWNTLIEQVEVYYREHSMQAREGVTVSTVDELRKMTMGMLNFTINDPMVVKVRRVLQKEQFRNEKTAQLATNHFLMGQLQQYTGIFQSLIAQGVLKPGDAEQMALEFTVPVTALIHLCDRQPEMKPWAMERIERHIDYCIEMFKA